MVRWDQTTAITAAMIARIPFVRGIHQIDFQVFVRVCDDMTQVYVRTSGPVSADCRSGAGQVGFKIVHAQLSDPGEEEVDDGQLRHSARHCSGPDLGFAGWGDENVIRQLRDGGLGHSRHGDRRGTVGPSHGESLDDFLGATAERDSHGDARLSAQCGMDELDVGVVVMLADQTDAFQLLGEIVGHEPAGTDSEEDGPRRDGDGAGHGFELFRVHRAGGVLNGASLMEGDLGDHLFQGVVKRDGALGHRRALHLNAAARQVTGKLGTQFAITLEPKGTTEAHHGCRGYSGSLGELAG